MPNSYTIPFVFLQYLRKRIFPAYNHAISLRAQKVFLFSAPETQPQNNNWYCEQALQNKTEIFSFESSQSSVISDCREFTEKKSTSVISSCTTGKYHYFWKEFLSSLLCLLFISLFEEKITTVYSTLAFFFKIYKDHFIQLRNITKNGVNS